MKKKYYLRGLGIGIFITALIMGLAGGKGKTMTDDEVRARAIELGMVEKKTLSDVSQDEGDDVLDNKEDITEDLSKVPEATNLPQNTSEPSETSIPQSTEAPQTTKAPANTSLPEETAIPQEENILELEIVKGDSSNSVSVKLEKLGLINDAKSYNRYLCDNGYDRRLNIGLYKIKEGTSEEEIAKIITRTR